MCCREISKNCYSKFSLAFHYNERLRLGHKTFKRPYGCLQQLLLIISGTVEINPGPINLKFPCGNCNGAVKKKDNSIACDSCNKWYHKDCLSMGDQVFNCYTKNENLDWICTNCALNDISYTLFDSSFSSIESDAPTCNIQRKKAKNLRISVMNFQSLWNKRILLERYLKDKSIDIVIGSESHLSANILNSEILPDTYTATRNDRNDGYGGVIIIYKKELLVEENPFKFTGNDTVSIKVETFEKPVIFCACYRSPNNDNDSNTNIINNLLSICQKYKNNPIWIGGDFNLPDIDWTSNNIVDHQNPKKLNEDFLAMFDQCNLTQHVDFSTRKNSTLDLLFTNRPTFVINCEPVPGISDHDTSVLADIICHPQKIKPIRRKINCWNRADIVSLRVDVDHGMRQFFETETVETPINDLWVKFKNILLKAQEKHVPTKSTRETCPY